MSVRQVIERQGAKSLALHHHLGGLGELRVRIFCRPDGCLNPQVAGARIDGWFYCPHHPRAVIDTLRIDCDCRKPFGGMVRRAQERFDLDLARSFVVGDKMTDVGLATTIGARGILLRTGHGEGELRRAGGTVPGAAFVADNLMDATSWMLGEAVLAATV